MKFSRTLPCLAAALLAAGTLLTHAQLRVDFNATDGTNGQDPTAPARLAGFQYYEARHEIAGDFTAARSYSVFGTTVNLTASFPDSPPARNGAMQMIDRTATNWSGAWPELLTDWIGIDTRPGTANPVIGGNGTYDGTTGTPTRLRLRLSALPTGTYTWRSYHHDVDNQHGTFSVQLSTDGGTTQSTIGNFTLTSGNAGGTITDPRSLPSTVTFPVTAVAGQDVLVTFTPIVPSSADISVQFFGCNGFELFDPANPPPGPIVAPPVQPAGTYAIDFGTAGSPVQAGYAQVLGANGSTVTINGVTFILPANSLAATYVPSVSSPLVSDFVANTANNATAGIVLQVNNLPAGTYTLESWHHDPTVTGAIQIETRTPQGFGNPITILVDQFAFGAPPATTTFTTAGGNFDIIVREDAAENNLTRWNGLRITSGVPDNSPVRPHSPWVFRTLMENRTRMLVAALRPNLWLSFNPGNCCIDRTWTGGMAFHGKVFDDSQRNSWINGPLYHRYPNVIVEATDEAAFPAGWTVDSGSVNHTSATDGTSFINPLRDKRANRWFKFDGTTTITTPAYDLSRHRETILFFEERQNIGTKWNLLPGSGTLRVQVSEDNGATWTAQDFFSTEANMGNQFNFKEITSRSPQTRLRFTSNGGQFANITLEGEYQGWTAENPQGAVGVTPNWLGYRTLNRDDAVSLRYALRLAGGAVITVEETPEARPQVSGPPQLERVFAVSGIPAGTTVSLRLSGDPAGSAHAESWAVSGAGSLRTVAGVTYLDLTADGTATVTATWTP